MKKDKLVVEEIVKYMQQQIKDGAWAVNTKIPSENELCSRLGVGRGSVRAAIQRFNVLGILESQHGRGTFVRSIDISLFGKGHYLDTALLTDMVTIRQARSLIEPELAYEAAANATPELIAGPQPAEPAVEGRGGEPGAVCPAGCAVSHDIGGIYRQPHYLQCDGPAVGPDCLPQY